MISNAIKAIVISYNRCFYIINTIIQNINQKKNIYIINITSYKIVFYYYI